MKTPLMELIEKLNKRKELGYKLGLTDSDESMIQINLAIHNATELLEKEMELARHAFLNAINMGDDISPKTANELFEDYYTKTFTNESK